MENGIKFDGEKPDMSLISSTWLFGVARVLTFGKRKYAAHNWRKGLAVSRLIAAALRHIFQFLSGEDKDPETGESHLYHASCCLMFAAETVEMRPEFDDRWKPEQPASYVIEDHAVIRSASSTTAITQADIQHTKVTNKA